MTRQTTRFRSPTPDELPFLFSSWLKSYRNAPAVRQMGNEDYFRHQALVIEAILPVASVTLAVDPEDESVIWGFVVWEGPVLHYLYVKHLLRQHGIARDLWRAAGSPTTCTHLSIAGEAYMRSHPGTLTFNPFLTRRETQ
jgi:hypothetical protein